MKSRALLRAAGGTCTSFGNAVTANGFLYEAMATTGDVWRLRRR